MTETYLQPEQQAEPRTARNNGANGGEAPHKKPDKIRRFRYLLSKTKFRVPLYWIRHRGLGASDVFFGSYPRSGSTWSRFTLYEVLTGRDAGFDAVNATLRGVHRLERGIPVLPAGGRLLGSHEQYRKEYKRAVYLVRDARDVVLSEYSYLKAMDFFRGDFDQFVAGFVGAESRINGFGPWQRHVTSWLDSPIAGTPNLLLVRFEDLRGNPEKSFEQISDFLGVKTTREAVQQAVANNSLKRMREKERDAPQLPTDSFVRSGSVQGWRGKLTQAQTDLIERHAGSVLLRLGYPLSTASREPVAVTS
ncbi:MAG TPA: sulfotransferase domain-containing protein [Terriglobales bacterium]|nr:sulfotransferase domain-containing protein [Terriglobales bacterium]